MLIKSAALRNALKARFLGVRSHVGGLVEGASPNANHQRAVSKVEVPFDQALEALTGSLRCCAARARYAPFCPNVVLSNREGSRGLFRFRPAPEP